MLEPFRAIVDGDEPPPPGSRAPDEAELRRQADNFIELDALRDIIGRPPREPREPAAAPTTET